MTTVRAPTNLTPHQRAAVDAVAPRILLVASAGSGKTEVLTRRVIRHLEESPRQTFRVLAVTFTVRAAQELKTRLQASASDEAWRVDADTIHGFALDWLMRFGQSVSVYPDTVVYSDDADRVALLAEYVSSLGEAPGDSLRSVLQAIDGARAQGWPPGDAAANGPSIGAVPFSDMYEGYLTALDAANGIDFAGMLAKFVEASEADPGFINNFQSTYRHVLVDEGQDLSTAHAEVISRLVGPEVDLFVVADDRQSINGFAGGDFRHAKTLVGDAAANSALHLPHNFRCSTEVLSAAEALAAHLRSRPSQAIAAENAPVGAVRFVSSSSPGDEAAMVGAWVQVLLNEGLDPSTLADGEDPTVAPEEVAVIARARWLLDPVLQVFEGSGVEVSLQTDSQSFLQTPTGRVFSEGIALLASPDNAPASRRLADELRGIGATTDPNAASLVDQLRGSGLSDLIHVADALDGLTVGNTAEKLRTLRAAAADDEWAHDVGVLETLWVNYTVAVPQNRRDLPGFVRHMFRAQQTRPSDPGVRLLTIHKVKGLEFKAVCLISAYNGSIPDYRASTDEDIDEERRAFYVAMTRASRSLLVTYPQVTVDRYGRQHRQDPSMFAVEAGLA